MDTREFGYCFSSFRVTCGFRAKTIQRKSRYLVRSFPFCLFISSFIYSPLTPGPTTSDKRSNRIVVQCVKELAALTGDWLIAFAVERQQRESDSDWFCPLFFFVSYLFISTQVVFIYQLRCTFGLDRDLVGIWWGKWRRERSRSRAQTI